MDTFICCLFLSAERFTHYLKFCDMTKKNGFFFCRWEEIAYKSTHQWVDWLSPCIISLRLTVICGTGTTVNSGTESFSMKQERVYDFLFHIFSKSICFPVRKCYIGDNFSIHFGMCDMHLYGVRVFHSSVECSPLIHIIRAPMSI